MDISDQLTTDEQICEQTLPLIYMRPIEQEGQRGERILQIKRKRIVRKFQVAKEKYKSSKTHKQSHKDIKSITRKRLNVREGSNEK